MRMINEKELRASMVYEKTKSLANGNAFVQGLSGVIGVGANLIVDVAAIPFYTGLWNDIRGIYGRGEITLVAAREFIKPNLGFLVQDFVWDKIIGSVPIVGIPFNVAFAKALTWRLGAWFGTISALGEEENPNETLIRASMQLTKEVFPVVGSVFSFKGPDKQIFIEFIANQDGLTKEQAQKRMKRALDALKSDED